MLSEQPLYSDFSNEHFSDDFISIFPLTLYLALVLVLLSMKDQWAVFGLWILRGRLAVLSLVGRLCA